MATTTARNPFRRPSYRSWYLATTLLAISTSTSLAVTLTLVDVTGSPATAGIVSGTITAVMLVAGFVGGGLSDVASRRAMLVRGAVVAIPANAVVAVLLALIASGVLDAEPLVAAGTIAALVVAACAMGVLDPVLDGSTKMLISPAEFPRSMSAEHARSETLAIAGSPASGALYGLFPALPFVLRMICLGGFLGALAAIRDDLGPGTAADRAASARAGSRAKLATLCRGLAGYGESFRFLDSTTALRRILISAPLVNLMVFSGSSWVVLDLTDRGASPLMTGVAVAGFAVGGLLGSAIAPWLTDRVRPGILAICGLGWMVVAFAGLFLTAGRPWWLFAIAALCMLPSPALNGGLFAHVFAETPADMQGRVMATFGLVGGIASVIAPMAAGVAVAHSLTLALGATTCGIGLIGVALLAASREVRRIPLQ